MSLFKMFSRLTLVLFIIAISVIVKLAEPAFLTTLQLKWFDLYQTAKPRSFEDLPVKIIDIDDASLQKIGQWPWPRTQVAELIRALGEAGVSAIALDIVFAEPDRTSPAHMQQLWQLEDSQALAGLPDHDDVLAKEIARWPVVVGSILQQQATPAPAAKSGFAFVGGDPQPLITEFQGVISNIDQLEAAAKGSGILNSDPDGDGILRKVPLVFRLGDAIYPGLSVEALRVAQGAGTILIKSVMHASSEKAEAIEAMKIGDIEIPTDRYGKFWVYYDHTRPERYIPAWQVMAGVVPDEKLVGQIVLIGTSAPGLKDLRSTPLNPSVAGVEVHAQLLEQMLQGITLHKPDWAIGAEILLIITAGLIAWWVSTRFIALIAALGLLAGLSGVLLGSWFAFDFYQLLLEPITTWIAMVMIYFSVTVWRFAKTERDKSKIRSTFSLYVSENLVNQLAENPGMVKLGGEKKDMTILFCDIRNFSAISERLDPEILTRLINSYLTPMTDIILQSGGMIDKYMGDAIMAIWNAPLPVEDHPTKAAHAALAMRNCLQQLNNQWAEMPSVAGKVVLPVRFGIGINSGVCSVGNMGSNQRFEYSVLGHEVDLASRLEGMSKYYGFDTILSERTQSRVQGVTTIQLDTIRVKGKNEPIRIYGLLADASLADNALFQDLSAAHLAMLTAYRQRHWREVEALLAQCRHLAAHVPLFQLSVLYNLYEQRVAQHVETPPSADWDGVFNADFK